MYILRTPLMAFGVWLFASLVTFDCICCLLYSANRYIQNDVENVETTGLRGHLHTISAYFNQKSKIILCVRNKTFIFAKW